MKIFSKIVTWVTIRCKYCDFPATGGTDDNAMLELIYHLHEEHRND